MEIGLELSMVRLESNSLIWSKAYEEVENDLSKLFEGEFLTIAHIGSTSINSIKAKPIIDILLVLPKDYDNNMAVSKLSSIFFVKGEFQRDGEMFFFKGRDDFHTHYLHFVKENQDWQRYILFRDYLRANKDVASEYESLKLKLSTTFNKNRQLYTSSKESFIENILSRLR